MIPSETIQMLTRFQIEAVLAFDYVGRNTTNAAELLNISYGSEYNDLAAVTKITGCSPFIPEQLDELLESIENYRKEQMGNGHFDIGEYLCGK